ncbi:hypothetical protein PYW08_014955 [Mythimna loreyi]|uniref:Uncharacterized protein n=1 Tax=Mythimna loreyi TaxID=667449 RepID=A0ACC2R603_9NEOP|nr:hypothetical protein PYW08_014955 [Mythimna loreyi]
MFRSFLVLCICGVSLSTSQAGAEQNSGCGPNEVFNACTSCPYEDSCYDRYDIFCLDDAYVTCEPGCVCKEGFIRKTLGRECIPKEECGAPCDIFELYTDCKQISKETCSSIGNPLKLDGGESCTPGCSCWDGYYRENETQPCLHRCLCSELENSPECQS